MTILLRLTEQLSYAALWVLALVTRWRWRNWITLTPAFEDTGRYRNDGLLWLECRSCGRKTNHAKLAAGARRGWLLVRCMTCGREHYTQSMEGENGR